uniref:Uncharacterized protein n=1 Tax=Arundo donax TaxID=35708 RepID=A0A0A9ESU2_ARUDO
MHVCLPEHSSSRASSSELMQGGIAFSLNRTLFALLFDCGVFFAGDIGVEFSGKASGVLFTDTVAVELFLSVFSAKRSLSLRISLSFARISSR